LIARQEIESLAHPAARILVYSNHAPVSDLIKLALSQDACPYRATTDTEAAASMLKEWNPQIAILDIDGGVDQTLAQIGVSRDTHSTSIPVLAITKSGDTRAKLEAFARGVDDVITFPFLPEELQARVQVMVRRSLHEPKALNPVLKAGDLEIDVLGRRVCDGASELRLTGIEQGLLCLLAANAGEVVSQDQILDALWGSDYMPDSNVVGRLVYRLRGKLHQDWRRPRSIVTVPGRGYRLVPEFLQSRRAPARSRPSRAAAAATGERRQTVESARVSRR